jgi:hypothetical protein
VISVVVIMFNYRAWCTKAQVFGVSNDTILENVHAGRGAALERKAS